jgi:hypothetical protein
MLLVATSDDQSGGCVCAGRGGSKSSLPDRFSHLATLDPDAEFIVQQDMILVASQHHGNARRAGNSIETDAIEGRDGNRASRHV